MVNINHIPKNYLTGRISLESSNLDPYENIMDPERARKKITRQVNQGKQPANEFSLSDLEADSETLFK